jgi:ABC-type multidrug transport system ATPase subunit
MTLAIDALSARRGGRVVLADVTLAVAAGEIVGIVGKNGCGKSTLLLCVAGVLAPHDGRIAISGASVWGAHRERLRARRALGYVPEGADPPGFLLRGELWALVAATRGCALPTPALCDALGLDELRDAGRGAGRARAALRPRRPGRQAGTPRCASVTCRGART